MPYRTVNDSLELMFAKFVTAKNGEKLNPETTLKMCKTVL